MQHIGTYVVERELGRGATGTVHLARTRAGRAVAVKVIRREPGGEAVTVDRVPAAIEAARRVGGFHTAPVLDAGTDGGAFWFATAYVPAPTLGEMLQTRGTLTEEELRRLGTGLAEALRSVHGCGLVHGGLKPSDVLMADDGPRVRDFGLRAEEGGGPAADVQALGRLLVAAGGGDVTRLPASLRGVVASCLAEDEAHRPDAAALIEAFHHEGPAAGGAVAAPPAPGPSPAYGPPTGPPPAPPYAPPPGAQAVQAPGPYAPPPQGAFGPPPTVPPPQPAPDGLEFLAMDRKNDFVADASGVSFTVHGHHTDLDWPHIRFAQHRRDAQGSTYYLTVSLVLVNGAQLACRVSTRNAWEVEQWAAQLDAVLTRFMPRSPQ